MISFIEEKVKAQGTGFKAQDSRLKAQGSRHKVQGTRKIKKQEPD
jgi:hypothetical protein